MNKLVTVKFEFKANAVQDGRTLLIEMGVMAAIRKTLAEHGYSLSDYSSPRIVGTKITQ
jgi:hypothetical protein